MDLTDAERILFDKNISHSGKLIKSNNGVRFNSAVMRSLSYQLFKFFIQQIIGGRR
jgi:hypothetical protein